MKKIAYLLTLIMLLVPLAGCAGDENDENDGNSVEGDWYQEQDLWRFNRNGTVDRMDPDFDDVFDWDGESGDWKIDESGRWSTEAQGTYITLYFGHRVTTLMFEVRGDWMFILDEHGRECTEYSREYYDPHGMDSPRSDWDNATIDQLPYPSICE